MHLPGAVTDVSVSFTYHANINWCYFMCMDLFSYSFELEEMDLSGRGKNWKFNHFCIYLCMSRFIKTKSKNNYMYKCILIYVMLVNQFEGHFLVLFLSFFWDEDEDFIFESKKCEYFLNDERNISISECFKWTLRSDIKTHRRCFRSQFGRRKLSSIMPAQARCSL